MQTTCRDSSMQTPCRDSSMQMPCRNSGMQTPCRNSSMQMPCRDSSMETPCRDSSMQTSCRDSSMQTPCRDSSMQTHCYVGYLNTLGASVCRMHLNVRCTRMQDTSECVCRAPHLALHLGMQGHFCMLGASGSKVHQHAGHLGMWGTKNARVPQYAKNNRAMLEHLSMHGVRMFSASICKVPQYTRAPWYVGVS